MPNIPRLLHRARFFSRLALPPTHANFPHPSLIHAICAAAAAWCAPAVYEQSASFKGGCFLPAGNSGNEQEREGGKMSFGLKQAFYGKESVQDGLNTGNRMFDVVRAMVGLPSSCMTLLKPMASPGFLLGGPSEIRMLTRFIAHSLPGFHRRHANARMLGVQRSRHAHAAPLRLERPIRRAIPQISHASSAGGRARARGKKGGGMDGILSRHDCEFG